MMKLDTLKKMKSASRKMDYWPTKQIVDALMDSLFEAFEKLADQHVYAVQEFLSCEDGQSHGGDRGTSTVKLFATEAEADKWIATQGSFHGMYSSKVKIHAFAKDAGY